MLTSTRTKSEANEEKLTLEGSSQRQLVIAYLSLTSLHQIGGRIAESRDQSTSTLAPTHSPAWESDSQSRLCSVGSMAP